MCLLGQIKGFYLIYSLFLCSSHLLLYLIVSGVATIGRHNIDSVSVLCIYCCCNNMPFGRSIKFIVLHCIILSSRALFPLVDSSVHFKKRPLWLRSSSYLFIYFFAFLDPKIQNCFKLTHQKRACGAFYDERSHSLLTRFLIIKRETRNYFQTLGCARIFFCHWWESPRWRGELYSTSDVSPAATRPTSKVCSRTAEQRRWSRRLESAESRSLSTSSCRPQKLTTHLK